MTAAGIESLELLRVEEVAKLLRIDRSVVYKLMKSGEIESVKIGRARRIAPEAVADYKNGLRDRARGAA